MSYIGVGKVPKPLEIQTKVHDHNVISDNINVLASLESLIAVKILNINVQLEQNSVATTFQYLLIQSLSKNRKKKLNLKENLTSITEIVLKYVCG